ncbi:MAG: hypothetical protein AUK55_03895 [Syntrophobacteraceae bacterium CG2_30_61_12]|nr:MAG: hypothetical protein AUK55_03895 [Syntrophobacteraceae bacterium CG2_30_61_12]
MDTHHHFLGFVLPFTIEARSGEVDLDRLLAADSKKSAKDRLASGDFWQDVEPKHHNKYVENLFPFLQEMLGLEATPDKAHNVARFLTLSNEIHQHLFPNKSYQVLHRNRWALACRLRFLPPELFLFDTGIGLLCLFFKVHGSTHSPEVADLVLLAYHLRDLRLFQDVDKETSRPVGAGDYLRKADRTYLSRCMEQGNGKTGKDIEPAKEFPHPFLGRLHQGRSVADGSSIDFPRFNLPELIHFLLQPLETTNELRWLINKYLIGYHFLHTDTYACSDDKARDLFYLRKNYKDTYDAAERDLQLCDNPELVQTYRNIVFGQSLEGGVVLVDATDHPFYQSFPDKARHQYLLPFLLALHQRVALIAYGIRINRLNIEDLHAVRTLRRRIIEFVLRWQFSQLSNLTSYNRVYRNWQRVLAVETLLREIKSEVNELDELLELEEQKCVARHWSLLNWLIFPVLIVSGVFGMNVWQFTGAGLSLSDPRFWLWVGGFFFLYYLLSYLIRRFIRRGSGTIG